MASSGKEITKKKKGLISASISQVLKNPSTVLKPKAWKKLANKMSGGADGRTWSEDSSNKGLKSRQYATYEDYIEHQKSKIDKKGKEYLAEYDNDFYSELLKRLKAIDGKVTFKGKNALCLAARIGTEVRSFIDAGAFAVGIDLNPGTENKYVVTGDFHKIQFADGTVDIVYTNSFDHVYDKDRVINEVKRLLSGKGFMILEMANQFGSYESLAWENPEDLIKFFTDKGFKIVQKNEFKYPWEGIQILFTLSK